MVKLIITKKVQRVKGEQKMATKGMNAYECAKVLYGANGEKIKEVMKSYPLFSKLVIMMNSPVLLELLEAVPKVTARVFENGLTNGVEDVEEEVPLFIPIACKVLGPAIPSTASPFFL